MKLYTMITAVKAWKLSIVCVLLLFLSTVSADDFFQDIDIVELTEKPLTNSAEQEYHHINGFFRQSVAYATQAQHNSQQHNSQQHNSHAKRQDSEWVERRSVLDIGLSGELTTWAHYKVQAYYSYDKYEVWDDGFEWREVYLNAKVDDGFWLKSGRQLIPWGQSDYTQILDLANPRDNRELGLVPAEDLRLPISATKLSQFGLRWGVDLVFIHEFRPEIIGAAGSDFDPYIPLRNQWTIEEGSQPDLLSSPEVLLRGFYTFPWGDLALIYGDVYEDRRVLTNTDNDTTLISEHQKIQAYGIAGNRVIDRLLLKFEWARKDNMPFAMSTATGSSIATSLSQWMLGGDYTLNGDTVIAAEWLSERIHHYDSRISLPKQQHALTLSARTELWREQGALELTLGHWFEGDSTLGRLAFSYDINDDIKLETAYLLYSADHDDALLYPFKNNDRITASIRYSF